MSIGKIQEKVLSQKGCGTIIAIGMAFTMSFFIFSSCGRGAAMQNVDSSQGASDQTLVTVGDATVTASQFTDAMNRMNAQQAPTFMSSAQNASRILTSLLTNAADLDLAKKDHVEVTDDALVKAATTIIDQQIDMQKMQLQIKPGASPAEVDAAFKKQMGKTPAEIKKLELGNLSKVLAQPDKRSQVASELVGPVLQEALAAQMKPTDAEVRSSYDTYVVKRILISNTPGTDAKAKAAEALKAVQGGMSFEAAMNKYSGEPPQGPGKKISDSVLNIARSMIGIRPTYKIFLGQKAGFVSPVMDEPEGETIYKITAIKNDAPKDFDANRDKYKKQYVEQQVQVKLQDEVKSLLTSNEVKWDSQGCQALYDVTLADSLSPAERDATLQKAVDLAKGASSKPSENPYALYAWYDAESELFQTPSGDKSKLIPGRIDLLNAVLQNNEDFDIRMELVNLETEVKKGQDALSNLTQASLANTTYDAEGQRRFGDLAAKADSLVKAKLVTEAELKPFTDAQDQWKKGKQDSDQEAAQMKQMEAAEKVKDASNDKANKEALESQRKAMKSSSPPPPPAANNKGAAPPSAKP